MKKDYEDKFIPDFIETIFKTIFYELNILGKGANNNLNKKDILKIKINIPVKENGDFDKQTQKIILTKYKKIEEIKKTIKYELLKIEKTNINFD